MDSKVLKSLFLIASLGLLIAGGIFLCISIFDGNETTAPLTVALACILLSILFNILRQMNNKKK